MPKRKRKVQKSAWQPMVVKLSVSEPEEKVSIKGFGDLVDAFLNAIQDAGPPMIISRQDTSITIYRDGTRLMTKDVIFETIPSES